MSAILAPDGSPARAAAARPAESSQRRPTPSSMNWRYIYEAANRADFRGYFYLPTLNPAEQLNDLSLSAIRERTDFLYANVGAVTMLIDRISLAESGTGIWPKWTTGQEDFDKAATDAYHYVNHDPRIFSADAQNDAYSIQYNIRRSIARGGDCFGQLLRPSSGATYPQFHLIPGWQCDNFGDESPSDGWDQGIRYNALGRPLEYKFLSGYGAARTYRTVPAEDVLHFHDPFYPGQRRGLPCLAPVAKKMFRREDIARALANGTLARERLGFAIELGGDDVGPGLDLGAQSDGEVETVTRTDGTKLTVKKLFGEGTSEDIEVPSLPNGAKITTVESNRPGTAVMEFQDSILREAAWARKYSAEFVFFMAGVGQGTVARGVQLSAGEVIVSTREFQMRPQFAIRWPIYWIWQLIKSGYFAMLKIKVPENWWQNKLVQPALPTMDVGREGALHDNRVATGKESIESYHGAQGEDASDVEDENLAALKRRARKLAEANKELVALGFAPRTLDEQWPRSINVPVAPPPPASNAPEDN
jgi:hypothetical protein